MNNHERDIHMRMKIYNFLVNRHSGIRQRYHRLHDNADTAGRIKSYAALAGMNVQYYLLGKREFDMPADVEVYEEKLLTTLSESAKNAKTHMSVEDYLERLKKYDVISFDIFDTLLLRPLSEPTDVFFFMGIEFGVMDFKRIRIEQEFLARQEHREKYGDNEVTFEEIWCRIEREVGIPASEGMRAELETEAYFCRANPFMLEIFKRLKEMGKTIICISDMYLSSEYMRELLEKRGFEGIFKIYMSGEHGKSKAQGDIYNFVKKDLKGSTVAHQKFIHIGDNEASDVNKAKEAGVEAVLYPNVNLSGKKYRAYDMSPVTGGAYRGVVNARIYNGLKKYHPEYEYGYTYGGLFVLGYVSFIHDYCQKNKIDKILFLSRDGAILKKAYDVVYPGENTSYTYISRAVATKLMRKYNRYDFFRRFIYYKVNRKIKVGDILKSMGLSELVDVLDKSPDAGVGSGDYLTSKNVGKLKSFLIEKFDRVNDSYKEMDQAAKEYYLHEFEGVKKAAVVDIGWAGSGAASLAFLSEKEWGLSCEVTGIVAGTNTPHNTEPDSAEAWLQQGCIVPYIFSQSLNRDIMKKHDPNKGYNVFWELLLSSPTRQFTGFEMVSKEDKRVKASDYKSEDDREQIIRRGDKCIRLTFGEHDANVKGAKRIQKGILDFVDDYTKAFKEYPFMFNISGRDAAAPMLLASSHKEKYLRAIAGRFDFKIDVN